MLQGSPKEMGFERKPKIDRLVDQALRPGWEVWRTPEGVLLVLPPACDRVQLQEVRGTRGVTLACVQPPGVTSIWPCKRAAQAEEA